MTTFVAIHGAWHRGWVFDPLRPWLDAGGHRLIAPDLPGVADPSDPEPATLARWADHVAMLVERVGEPVVLCGHSRGGIVVSEVAERVPASISALVYICAFMLEDGTSQADLQVPRPPGFADQLLPTPDGLAVTVSPGAAMAVFYNGTPNPLAKAALKRLVPEPVAIRTTRLRLTAERFGSVPRHYIECADDIAIPLAYQRAMQDALPVLTSVTLSCDHSPFLSRPALLAAQLLRVGGDPRAVGSCVVVAPLGLAQGAAE